MTFAELVERAKRQLNAGQAQSAWPASEIDLAACVLQARDAVARKVMMDNAYRALLQQAYTLALDSAGEGDLTAATGSIAGTILLEGIKFGVVIDADGNVLQPITHYADFLRPQNTAFGYYNQKSNHMATRAIDAQANGPLEIVGANGPLTIIANFTPDAVDDYPPELDDMLIQALVNIVAAKVKPANADSV